MFKSEINSIEVNAVAAQMFGVPLFLHENGPRRRFIVLSYSLICFILFNICYLYCEILDLIQVQNDVNKIGQNLCLTITHFGGNLKFLNVLFRFREIQTLINNVAQLPADYVKNQEHVNILVMLLLYIYVILVPLQKKIYRNSEVLNKSIVAFYSTMVLFNCFAGLTMLILDPTIGGDCFPYRALLPDFLPLEMRIAYWCIGTLVLGLQIVAIDSLNIILMNQISLHLKLLNQNLIELTSTEELERDPLSILKECIKYNQLILGYRNQIEGIFKYPILVQFLISLLVFVVTGFQAILSISSEDIMQIYIYCLAILFQLFSYCWFANQVMEENKLLGFAAYSTYWTNFGVHYSKVLLLFMVNVQKPLTFTAGGFFILSLNRFTDILSRSYSYLAVLRQVYANYN